MNIEFYYNAYEPNGHSEGQYVLYLDGIISSAWGYFQEDGGSESYSLVNQPAGSHKATIYIRCSDLSDPKPYIWYGQLTVEVFY